MVFAIVTWELHLSGCQSLKDKRRILMSLKDRLHKQFNVSVAETGHQDLWQRAELACGVVATDRSHAISVLGQADKLVEGNGQVRIIDSATTVL